MTSMHTIAFEPIRSSSPLPEQLLAAEEKPNTSTIWINDETDGARQRGEACRRRSAQIFTFLLALALLAAAFYGGSVVGRQSLETKLEGAETVRNELLENQKRLLTEKAELGRYSRANEELSHDVELLKRELDEKKAALKAEELKRTAREEEIFQYLEQYHKSDDMEAQRVRREDLSNLIKTMAYDRYGARTQQVQVLVRVWNDEKFEEGTFTIEMASFEDMPASSFHFLEQVDRGLWDGTSFYMNAPHMLMAQPVSGTHDSFRLPEMEAMGLARVPMQEYSERMPHKKYTLGFGAAAATSGSFFFINKTDNSSTQTGQACFAKVVSGFDVIDKMAAVHADRTTYHIQPIDIVAARVVDNE